MKGKNSLDLLKKSFAKSTSWFTSEGALDSGVFLYVFLDLNGAFEKKTRHLVLMEEWPTS